jgi:hypothetical protein
MLFLSSLHLVLAAAALVPWAGRQGAGGGGRHSPTELEGISL